MSTTKTKKPTLPKLEELEYIGGDDNITPVYNHLQTFMLEYPKQPAKPSLQSKHSAAEAKEYVVKLEEYETAMKVFKAEERRYNEQRNDINELLKEYIKKQANLESVPEKYREKVWNKAYNDGDGWQDKFYGLRDLVDIFN